MNSLTAKLVGVAALLTALVLPNPQSSSEEPDDLVKRSPAYVNTETQCIDCHVPKVGRRGLATQSEDFMRKIEASIWEEQDKHSQAFELLRHEKNHERVRRMVGADVDEIWRDGQIVAQKEDSQEFAILKQCLRCHSGWPIHANQDNDVSERPPPNFTPEAGVSCQVCHGPGEDWILLHAEKTWRLVTPTAKARLGMTDVRNPTVRIRLCASCHVGDESQGRVVKHEWYAKGHPPLPSFEPETFAIEMPAHWLTLKDKGNFDGRDAIPTSLKQKVEDLKRSKKVPLGEIKNSYIEANRSLADAPLPRTKGILVAGLTLLRVYARLVEDACSPNAAASSALPEFAMFDCAACHHELRSSLAAADRPRRRSPPGRPQLQQWPAALARVSLIHLAGGRENSEIELREYSRRLNALEKAATLRPFGNPDQMHSASQVLGAWLERKIVAVEESHVGNEEALRILRELTSADAFEYRDYHSARQAAWAIHVILRELREAGAIPGIEGVNFFTRSDHDDPLSLRLPSGQSKQVIDELPQSLKSITEYDAGWFSGELARLREALINVTAP